MEQRICDAGIISEWKAFAALAVDYLGMEPGKMPFYSKEIKWSKKAEKIINFVLMTGNFGHNRDYSYYKKYPFVVFKTISLWRHTCDFVRYFMIFPLDSLRAWWNMVRTGVAMAMKGK